MRAAYNGTMIILAAIRVMPIVEFDRVYEGFQVFVLGIGLDELVCDLLVVGQAPLHNQS